MLDNLRIIMTDSKRNEVLDALFCYNAPAETTDRVKNNANLMPIDKEIIKAALKANRKENI